MMKTETLKDGALVRHYSDTGMMIRQIETGTLYSEAVDAAESEHAYTETDTPAPVDKESADAEALGLLAANINTLALDDNTALHYLDYHPEWQRLCDQQYTTDKKGYRFQHKGVLYETVQEIFTFQPQWVPGTEGTASIYSQVGWQHAGTMSDPIPVPDDVPPNSFTYIVGKVYDENGELWKCERQGEVEGTEHVFPYKPSQAVGYFVKVE